MIVSLFISVARRIRTWTAARRNKRKDLRMHPASSVRFINKGNKSYFKFLN